MNVSEVLIKELLPRVEKPSRYLGTELNAVRRDWNSLEVRLAVAFPDLYDLGLGNLGIHILYACLNALDWAGCERVYAPAPDMEKEMRARAIYRCSASRAVTRFKSLTASASRFRAS